MIYIFFSHLVNMGFAQFLYAEQLRMHVNQWITGYKSDLNAQEESWPVYSKPGFIGFKNGMNILKTAVETNPSLEYNSMKK